MLYSCFMYMSVKSLIFDLDWFKPVFSILKISERLRTWSSLSWSQSGPVAGFFWSLRLDLETLGVASFLVLKGPVWSWWWAAKLATGVGHWFAHYGSRTHDRACIIRPKASMPNSTWPKDGWSSQLPLALPSTQHRSSVMSSADIGQSVGQPLTYMLPPLLI